MTRPQAVKLISKANKTAANLAGITAPGLTSLSVIIDALYILLLIGQDYLEARLPLLPE